MERPRDRRRRQRQHVHRQLQRLEPLFVPDPEAMFLVHDQQPEILERHVPRQEPMGPDHDVDFAPRDAGHDAGRLLRGSKP